MSQKVNKERKIFKINGPVWNVKARISGKMTQVEGVYLDKKYWLFGIYIN